MLRIAARSARRALLTTTLALGLGLTGSGCSLIFVKGPPNHPSYNRPVECTSSKLLPILDVVATGLELTRTAVAAHASDADYKDAPISRSADIGFGLGLSALFVGSAMYGLAKTDACSDAMARYGREPFEGLEYFARRKPHETPRSEAPSAAAAPPLAPSAQAASPSAVPAASSTPSIPPTEGGQTK